MRSSKKYTKLENWFFQMQSKLLEESVWNIKKNLSQLMHVKVNYNILNL